MPFFVVLAVVFLDQLTKYLACERLLLNESLAVVPNFLYLTLVHNQGAAFGILKGKTSLFIFTSAVTIIFIYFLLTNNQKNHSLGVKMGFALILAGAVGNLIDRISLGYVIDFLDFRIWPVFNLADTAITCGIILLGWRWLWNDRQKNSACN